MLGAIFIENNISIQCRNDKVRYTHSVLSHISTRIQSEQTDGEIASIPSIAVTWSSSSKDNSKPPPGPVAANARRGVRSAGGASA